MSIPPQFPHVWKIAPALIYLIAVLGFLALATTIYWPLPERAFLSDNSPVSWLGSVQLWTIAVLALRLSSWGILPKGLGFWLFFALIAMALDEQFMFHEQWKYGCEAWLSLCRLTWVRELPMILVGSVGLITLLLMHRAIRVSGARACLWAAYATGVFALYLDLASPGWEIGLYEEGFEVLAEALFLGALLGLDRIIPSPLAADT